MNIGLSIGVVISLASIAFFGCNRPVSLLVNGTTASTIKEVCLSAGAIKSCSAIDSLGRYQVGLRATNILPDTVFFALDDQVVEKFTFEINDLRVFGANYVVGQISNIQYQLKNDGYYRFWMDSVSLLPHND